MCLNHPEWKWFVLFCWVFLVCFFNNSNMVWAFARYYASLFLCSYMFKFKLQNNLISRRGIKAPRNLELDHIARKRLCWDSIPGLIPGQSLKFPHCETSWDICIRKEEMWHLLSNSWGGAILNFYVLFHGE